MNESDRAAFADADHEYDALALPCDIMDQIEDLWLNRQRAAAAKLLSKHTTLTTTEARALLRRVYG
jgi:hypothetical protein